MAEVKRGRPRKIDSETPQKPVIVQDSEDIKESDEVVLDTEVIAETAPETEITESISETPLPEEKEEEVSKNVAEKAPVKISAVCEKCAYQYRSPVCKSCIEYNKEAN